MTEQEAKQVLEKILEHIDNMPPSMEIALIGEALRIAIKKLGSSILVRSSMPRHRK